MRQASLAVSTTNLQESASEPAGLPAAVTIEDWDTLFQAVTTRLTMSIGPLQVVPYRPEDCSQIETVVLQCVEALEQLHAMLKNERERRDNAAAR
jgi:hypothetical protein